MREKYWAAHEKIAVRRSSAGCVARSSSLEEGEPHLHDASSLLA